MKSFTTFHTGSCCSSQQNASEKKRARKKFAFALIVFGAIYAFFALAQELASNGRIFWLYTPRFNGAIYGSYVNHNHYAGTDGDARTDSLGR